MSTVKHPLQPLIKDEDGIVRFKGNAIARFLLDDGPHDLDRLAALPFSQEDREQFTQLLGYSLCGFSELSYVRDETYQRAAARQADMESGDLTLPTNKFGGFLGDHCKEP